MRRLGCVLATVFVLAGASAGLAGCGTSHDDGAATTTTESTGAPTTSTTVSSTTSSTAEPASDEIADGRSPAYITKVDVAAKTVTFDVVQFLTGAAAAKAAAEDKQESPPPNDSYIRNQSKRLRTLAVSDSATVTVNSLEGGGSQDHAITLAKLASHFGPGGDGAGALFWLTIGSGAVTAIEQQYLP
jgi:hypothetical protein